MSAFTATDLNCVPLEIEFDGDEGVGYWIQHDDDWYPLSIEDSRRLLLWAKDQLEEGMG